MYHVSKTQKPDRRVVGAYGEDLVASYLQNQGFTLLERNYKKFYGEIDLIAKKDDTIIFVEVKTRKKAYFELSQLITYSKQQKIIKTAESYIVSNQLKDTIFRFDVALLVGTELHYIPNAFTKKELI